MLLENQHPKNKSIMIALMGLPNVGKSSLLNYLLGQDLSIVSPREQTTRVRMKAIFTIDHTEVIVMDNPGLHRSSKEINRRMVEEALLGGGGADVTLVLFDLSRDMDRQAQELSELLKDRPKGLPGECWGIFTKLDRIPGSDNEKNIAAVKKYFASIEKFFFTSSTSGDGYHDLSAAIMDRAESGPHLFPGGSISDKSERFFASEFVREQLFLRLKEEIPYEVAVLIEDFKDFRGEKRRRAVGAVGVGGGDRVRGRGLAADIAAVILVNRPSQRAIVIGKGGQMIKEIGTEARVKIEELVGGKVNLRLHVKVSQNWFKNHFILEELGLARSNRQARAWRAK